MYTGWTWSWKFACLGLSEGRMHRVINAILFSLALCVTAQAGLSLEVSAVYRVPGVRQMSGITVLSQNEKSTVCLAVSDKTRHLYRLRVPRAQQLTDRETILQAKIVRTIDGAVDLEDLSYDKDRAGVWITSEHKQGSPGMLYFVPLKSTAPVQSFTIGPIVNKRGNGAECLALVPVAKGFEVWLGKERLIPPSDVPKVYRYAISGNTANLRIALRSSFQVNLPFHRTQSGMTFDPARDVIWVISRELRTMLAVKPSEVNDDLVSPDDLSFRYRWDELLGNRGTVGMVEGVATDNDGWFYVAVDNNEKEIGMSSRTRSRESRLLVLRPEN